MLKTGDKVPRFEGIDQDGKPIAYSDYKGKRLVVFFYPKASTPGCTLEACNLRDNAQSLKAQGYEIVGVSADTSEKQKNFETKNRLPFKLIADTDKEIIRAFGVWGPKKFMGRTYEGIHRTTFLIDEAGMISRVIEKVKTKDHADQILNA
ncbi:MAG: thioredoxin-dependent thiol peroxidase [Flavobacteriales bacterium]